MQELTRQIGKALMPILIWSRTRIDIRRIRRNQIAKRLAFAHDARAVSADCADAYVLLAQEETDTVQRPTKYYTQRVAAGGRAMLA